MSVLLPLLLWSVVEVHSQTEFPYVSFMGETLANHSYVNLTLVGTDFDSPGNTLRCISNLDSCCSAGQGQHRGDWYFPNGKRLPFIGQSDIAEAHGAQRVELHHRNTANSSSGIYLCDIPTNAVHDENDYSVREGVYVGLYATGGNVI